MTKETTRLELELTKEKRKTDSLIQVTVSQTGLLKTSESIVQALAKPDTTAAPPRK